jgi:glycosyltransferase involved in cell wall biosynthesis
MTGFVITSADSSSLASAAVEMLKDPALRAKMKDSIRNLAEMTLSWNALSRQTEVAYRV